MKILLHALLLAVALVLGGCDPVSTAVTATAPAQADIGQEVKAAMQSTLSADPDFKEYGLQVQSVIVVSEGVGNKYQGMASVTHQGRVHQVPVTVTIDGQQFIWRSEPGAFDFVAQAALDETLEDIQ